MEQKKYTPRGRAQVSFDSVDPAEPQRTGQPSRQLREGRKSGSARVANPERSGGAAARRAAALKTDASDASNTVLIRCQCGWEKRVPIVKVINAFRGHYGYAHPNLRLPSERDSLAAIVLEDTTHCPTCNQPIRK